MQEFELRSVKDGATLTFSGFTVTTEGIEFVCRFVSRNFAGAVKASTYLVESPSRFFAAIADEWKSEKEWRDLEDSIVLRAKGDALGHVTLSVNLRDRDRQQQVSGQLELELGQLDTIAAAMRTAFDALEQSAAWTRK